MQKNRYHHLGWHHGIELFEAALTTQNFSRHAHEGFAIGAIAEGAGGYLCRGENMVLPAGSLSLLNPEEVHTGHAPAGRVRYTMLYASETAVHNLLGLRNLHGFATIGPRDKGLRLTRGLAQLASCLNAPSGPDWHFAVEEAVHAVLAQAFTFYGQSELRKTGKEPAAIKVVCEQIAAAVEAGEALTVAELANGVGLNSSYLIRSFARETGMTPHAHVLQTRVQYAHRLLLDGIPAAEAAIAAGFCDQPHLIRQFRRHYGVTPGALIRH